MHPLIKDSSFKPRRYQESIVASAISENTLVVLPTGLGKTVIAAMVIAHRIHELAGSKALFLAPTKPLAVQHMRSFEKLLDVEDICVLTGADAPDERLRCYGENKIVFATPQTVQNDILRGLDLSGFSIVVFDEAHRAVGDYSYVSIAKKYVKKNPGGLIMGLTASPSSERDKVDAICANLFIQNVEAKTESDEDVKEYVQDVKVNWVRVTLPEEFSEIQALLKSAYKDQLERLKQIGALGTTDVNKVTKTQLLKLQSSIRSQIRMGGVAYMAASAVASAIKVNHAIELLESHGIHSLSAYFKKMKLQSSKAVKGLLKDERIVKSIQKTEILKRQGLNHPKVDSVADIVSRYKGKKVLVFTQFRDTIPSIIEHLNSKDILAHEFVGQAKKGAKKGMSQKDQINVLENFRDGKYTALVATSVAEEGLDIPKVDAVIFFEPVPSEIRSIQRRGRTGRQSSGDVYILIAKGTRDEGYYWASHHKEKRMKSIVKEMGSNVMKTQPQTALAQFEDEGPKDVKVIVDSRERNARINDILDDGAEIELSTLPVGDYLVSERACVERKTKEDFLGSLMDGRLMSQMLELKRNFDIAVLIVEGEGSLYEMRNIHENAVRGALSSIIVDYGVSVLFTEDEEDTAKTILALAKREQLENKKPLAIRGGKRPDILADKQRYVVESLPNVSAVLAKRLLRHFKSVKSVVNATEEDLVYVEGIGKKKAESILDVINSSFETE